MRYRGQLLGQASAGLTPLLIVAQSPRRTKLSRENVAESSKAGTTFWRRRYYLLFVESRLFLLYELRDQLGLPREKQRGSRMAAVDHPFLSEAEIIRLIKIDPFPRLERLGLLEISEDEEYYIVNPALLQALSPEVRSRLRALAIRRLAGHFGEAEAAIEELVKRAIG